jgi:methionine aminopeptidase
VVSVFSKKKKGFNVLALLTHSLLMMLRPDGWTATTKDGKRSAQFEHTLLVTETGVEILT